ncbi:MAG: polysaccharide deacetylase family protein [Kiritimatiellia bacterium]|jgi:peptidoglycan/xylan/chitin deacetylase (PgdA/CDA1 family)
MKIAQCWDDGVVNDIRLTELLRRYGAKATFNLNPGLMGETRGANRWAGRNHRGWGHNGFLSGKLSQKDIAEIYSGFQVASHGWRHEVAGTVADDEWIKSALDARHYLEDIVQRDCTGFAWPCGAHTPETIDLLRRNGFSYARTTVQTYDVTDCAEPMKLNPNCHFMARDFWDRYERARDTGVFYFWGHSYEMYEYDALWDQFEQKIQVISEDPDAEWVDVVDIVPVLKKG